MADPRTQQAVILNLVIIGEAATKLLQTDAAFTAQHAEIPWRSMRGMRNRIAHGYFEINLDVVWETTKIALHHPVIVLPSILENLYTGKDLNADGTK